MIYKLHNVFILLAFIFATFLPQQPLSAQTSQISPDATRKINSTLDSKKNPEFIEGEVIVKYKKNKIDLKKTTGKKKAENSEAAKGLKKLDEVEDLNLRLIKTTGTTKEAIRVLANDPDVEFAEPNFKRYPMSTPNDTQYSNQWALSNINAPGAWDLETEGQQDIIVAIIDTGVDYTHPDLIGNLWNGSTCVDENNISISGGCPKHGWNMENNSNDQFDIDGHGTFIAGIIGATSDNSQGISGISSHNNIKIMSIKFGFDTLSEIKAINFAKNNGAKVINASFGGSTFSNSEKSAIDAFPGIFVAATGNETKNIDTSPIYPASYTSSNIISVAATDSGDNLASFSNYGATSVDLAAPGVNVKSTDMEFTTFFNEFFDSSSPPSIPFTFSNASAQWQTASWQDTNQPNDKYATPGNNYDANSNIEIITSTPIDATSSEALYLSFYITGDIEVSSNCTADYLGVYTDNSDGNWVQRENYCGYSTGETVSINLTAAKSSQMRIKFLWHTNGTNILQNFYSSPELPYVDDILLNKINLNNSIYRDGSGTSYATPYVAGAAALVLSKKPTLSSTETKNVLLNSVDQIVYLTGKTVSGGRLNLERALENAIIPASTPIYRFWSNAKQGHFFTSNSTEKDSIIANDESWQYEGEAYKAFNESSAEITQIYRFWSNSKQHHFYTASESEKNSTIANDKSWNYEGVAYYAYATEQSGATAVYRFWSNAKQGHFFTSNVAEKDSIVANDKSWNYEGIAWYVPTN
jgi:subtilisin family serine protease